MHFQGGLSVARKKKNSSLTGKRIGRANDEGMQMQFSDGN